MRIASAVLLSVALARHPQTPATASDPATLERARWKSLAARCGAELSWAKDWDEAAARAKAEKKPVLAVAWLYSGFDIPDASQSVFAMDPDVIELVNARFVPMRLAHDTKVPFGAQTSYGLSPTSFGAALLVVAPDGRVLADSPHWQPLAAYDFLCETLAAHPELAGDERPRKLAGDERAAWHLARGELDEAAKLLADPKSARGYLLKSRLLRLRHETEAAFAALATARERVRAPDELAGELDLEELDLALLAGDVARARSVCARLEARDPARPEALAAEHVLGVLDFFAGDRAGAERRWRALADAHADSRWGVEAAAALLEPETQLGDYTLDHGTPELLASLRNVAPAPLGERAPKAALDPALDWLANGRRSDGSWIDPSEVEAGPSAVNAISVAVDVLASRALLAHRAHRPLDLARETRLAIARARESLEARGTVPSYMTYEVWSDALTLELIVDLLEAGAHETGADMAAELRALGTELAAALAVHQRSNGGWSYFDAVSLSADAVKPEQSISFVTATVVLALQRARAAGIEFGASASASDPDDDEIERGLDALEAMRSEAGVFAYMLWSFQRTAPPEPVAGCAGRAPLCELALVRAERADAKSLAAALDQFFEHAATLQKETGKALMHCGPEGQGCHYVLYDYATAARAIAALPASERKPYRARLYALLDSARRADGTYQDTPILGPASGTALALLAFADLARE